LRTSGSARRGRLELWLLLGAILVLTPAEARALTLLGSDFLSPGPIEEPGFTLFGEAVAPRLDLDGLMRVQFLYAYLNGEHQTDIVPQLDLQLNLQLTATQRVYALLRPIERGDREPTVYQAFPGGGWTVRSQATPEALFYEGQPFNWLSPDDRLPLDISIAGGRIPFFLHNGLWFANFFDGFSIAKNNIQVGTLSNLNVLYFLTRGQTQPGITLTTADRREQEKNLTGIDLNLDWNDYFVEASWAKSYGNGTVEGLDQDLNRNFWALSVTRTLNFDAGASIRAMGNTGNATTGAGVLFALETQYGVLGTQLYLNVFGATRDWIPPTVQGSPLSREGILYTFDRLIATPQLNPRGAGTVGGVLGDIVNPRGWVTLTPEFGWLVDEESPGTDQVGLALLLQVDLAHLLLPGDGLAPMVRRGLLYGALARVTLVGIRNEDLSFAPSRYEYGSNVELIYQF
jgi:hypothetical protein